MSRPSEELLNPLWAATLDEINVDVLRERVVITAHALDGDDVTRYVLECVDAKDMRYERGDREHDWEYVEISEAHLRLTAGGRFEVELEFWVPGCQMTLDVGDVTLQVG
jgi:hypothetical protein